VADTYDVLVIGAGPAGEHAAGRLASAGLRVAIVERELVVEVETADGAIRPLRAARAVVLATGSRPFVPPVPGLAEARPWDNRAATSTKEVPRRLLVLGGGAVGVEMAQAFKRLGSEEVVILEGADRLLAREEPFAGEELRAAFEAEGITVVTGARITAARRLGRDGPVVAQVADGREFTGDEILVAVGRRPATDGLGLEHVGLEPGQPVWVDRALRAAGVPGGWLYAIGDCNGLAPLTHMGKYHGRIAAAAILGQDVADAASRDVVPRVTFTDPQVCAVGPTAAQARAAGLPITVVSIPTGEVPGAYTQGTGIRGTSQLVIDDQRRTVVGATFTGPGLQELLHSATVAICGGVTVDQLRHAVPSFPTVSEVWLHLLEAYGL
jgi:pyruvate/2-oxoglutarate dehydrogenase complex dihydrolipoamide dehydrogenase (E3) component